MRIRYPDDTLLEYGYFCAYFHALMQAKRQSILHGEDWLNMDFFNTFWSPPQTETDVMGIIQRDRAQSSDATSSLNGVDSNSQGSDCDMENMQGASSDDDDVYRSGDAELQPAYQEIV